MCPYVRTSMHIIVRDLASRLKRSRVQVAAFPLPGDNLGQVVRTRVPLSLTTKQCNLVTVKRGDALRPGR